MTAAPTVLDEASRSYWDALSRGDRATAIAVARQARDSGASVEEILSSLVCAAQVQVGKKWAANEWSVAQEHIATSIGEDVLAVLAAEIDAPAQGSAVVTCGEGEWHALPARVLAESLRLAGWRVHYLGASIPTPHLAQQLQDVGPDLTAISCSISTSLPRVRSMIEASRGAGIPVIVGGRGFGAGGRWASALGANAWAPTAAAAVEVLSDPTWPTYTVPAPPLPAPDDATEQLAAMRQTLVERSHARLGELFEPMATYNRHQLDRTVEDLGHILDFLGAALFVDDPSLFVDFAVWLGEILVPRGVPLAAARLGMEAIDEVLPDLPRARAMLRAGIEVLRD
ncbi:MAG: cobalamin B12-binding domain-containing protein [Sporichthyaceae bacterium]